MVETPKKHGINMDKPLINWCRIFLLLLLLPSTISQYWNPLLVQYILAIFTLSRHRCCHRYRGPETLFPWRRRHERSCLSWDFCFFFPGETQKNHGIFYGIQFFTVDFYGNSMGFYGMPFGWQLANIPRNDDLHVMFTRHHVYQRVYPLVI